MSGHDLDPVSLVFGAVFALLGLAFLLLPVDAASIHLERVWPVMVMAMGLLIVALSARGRRWGHRPRRGADRRLAVGGVPALGGAGGGGASRPGGRRIPAALGGPAPRARRWLVLPRRHHPEGRGPGDRVRHELPGRAGE